MSTARILRYGSAITLGVVFADLHPSWPQGVLFFAALGILYGCGLYIGWSDRDAS